MESEAITLLIAWICISTVIAGLLARNRLSRGVNVTLLTGIGYVIVVAGLVALSQAWIPYRASPFSMLPPIAVFSAAAAVLVALLGYVRIGQVRRKQATQ